MFNVFTFSIQIQEYMIIMFHMLLQYFLFLQKHA